MSTCVFVAISSTNRVWSMRASLILKTVTQPLNFNEKPACQISAAYITQSVGAGERERGPLQPNSRPLSEANLH